MLLGTSKIRNNHHLEIGGCDTVDLAARFGTPLYVMDEAEIRGKMRAYRNSFEREYRDAAIAYATKAFGVTAMCAIAMQEGLWLDVASAGELHTAALAGFPTDHILFHGNFKTPEELDMAVELGVGFVVVDSLQEMELLGVTAVDAGNVQDILIRCNPGVDPHTHRLISTGQEDSKFGFNMRNGDAMAAVRRAAATPGLRLRGLHCHLGSQLLDLAPYTEAVPVMVEFMARIRDDAGLELEVLDVGGGLGVRYLEEHAPPSVEQLAKLLSETLVVAAGQAGIAKPMLIVEPGRSIVAEAGTTLYTVGASKTVGIAEPPGERTYLPVDGGLSDNLRPGLYAAVYSAMLANRADEQPARTYTVSGRHCETDTLIPSIRLPEARVGDVLAVQTTGAYNHAMASNYNRFPRPAVVLVNGGEAELIARRETIDDVVRNDVLPERLRPSVKEKNVSSDALR